MYIFLSRIFQKLKYYARIARGTELYYPTEVNLKRDLLGDYTAEWCVAADYIDKNSIVYSVGVGTDISFDKAIIEKYGVQLYAMDPTPRSFEWLKTQKLPANFHFHGYGLADNDGVITFFPPTNENHVSFSTTIPYNTKGIDLPVYRLDTIAEKLGHTHIDILKMDIEGSEYGVIEDLRHTSVKVRQLLVEFHHRFDGGEMHKTKQAVATLQELGYKIFYISPTGEEYSFIRL